MSLRGRIVRGFAVVLAFMPAPIQRRVQPRVDRFFAWREERPFWGGVLLMVAGVIISAIPAPIAMDLVVYGEFIYIIGIIWGLMAFLSGAFALSRPDLAGKFGVIGIAASILSLFGAIGGYGIGLLLGVIGGNLLLAWEGDEDEGEITPATDPSDEVQFSWETEE